MINVLFVCLGNICRSPMAEAVFNKLIEDNNLQDRIRCDSAGTSDYHIDEPPDSRTIEVVNAKDLSLDHKGRQFLSKDFDDFNYIIAMDEENKKNILKLEYMREPKHYQVFLMREFENDASDLNVPDPYWSGQDGFMIVYDILQKSAQNLLAYIRKEHQL
ncbi:protein-tyrosine phosphatase [Catalinimonas alkaloidigena]|uniref:low molecular weight protein-tyrosine-phosphatase n=1 Tax=Catalinimonas alkaloidigena TaxID=1075417 RepID=UPI002406F959|nr:low molecular weight protein-tyrosine-phosphatase [Catalinimonas alkaloidigena]MDF9798314.1 protein-tyrosine phosphatase [Catalinimonas alkaloidigena]